MKSSIPLTQRAGILLAVAAATISGVAVFLNGMAVKQAPGAISFTTAKNLVAAGIIVAVLCATSARREAIPSLGALRPAQWVAVTYVGVISGGVAFGLFFIGLAQANATEAAFVQKTLIIWVALLAVPILHEKLGLLPAVAIGALVAGQILLTFGSGAGKPGMAGALAAVLMATLLWSIEIIILRRLLQDVSPPLIGAIRMGVGSVVLLGWLALTGSIGQLGTMGAATWGWVALTGVLLSGYVLTWFGALRRAQAVDVTAVLVLGAFITALLSMAGGTAMGLAQVAGLILIVGGVAVIVRIRTGHHAVEPA